MWLQMSTIQYLLHVHVYYLYMYITCSTINWACLNKLSSVKLVHPILCGGTEVSIQLRRSSYVAAGLSSMYSMTI